MMSTSVVITSHDNENYSTVHSYHSKFLYNSLFMLYDNSYKENDGLSIMWNAFKVQLQAKGGIG